MNLPQSETTAELVFPTPLDAANFAKAYSRKTLRGHSVGGNKVNIDNVTDEVKHWISDYISTNFGGSYEED